jgi:hypothetical protein
MYFPFLPSNFGISGSSISSRNLATMTTGPHSVQLCACTFTMSTLPSKASASVRVPHIDGWQRCRKVSSPVACCSRKFLIEPHCNPTDPNCLEILMTAYHTHSTLSSVAWRFGGVLLESGQDFWALTVPLDTEGD